MSSTHRSMFTAFIAIAALTMMCVCQAMSQEREDRPTGDPLDYPVLLVHGLGEGPGEEAFGSLQELLESYYFDVEVMDFNSYAGNSIARHRDAGNLGTLAAILGIRIRSVLKQYNTDRLHIVAHSYGGLIVQAYLLDYGEDYSSKKGGYGDNVDKVVYIQVPFYGVVTDDEETLRQIVEDTDYGPYTDWQEIMRTLELGSQWIYDMDVALRIENLYRDEIDAITLVAGDDEFVPPLFGTLNAFMEKGRTHTFHRFRIFDGQQWGNYTHSQHPLSKTRQRDSLAYVQSTTDPVFLSIVSFLEGGNIWRKIGMINLPTDVIVMVKYDKVKGYKNIGEGDVTLTLKKKAKGGNGSRSDAARAAGSGDVSNGYFNSRSRIFVFSDLAPGRYDININNPKGEDFEQGFEFYPTDLKSYAYNPKKNELREGDVQVSDLEGLYTLGGLVYPGNMQSALVVNIAGRGLNTNGFAIEFDIENADPQWYDKGVVFSMMNQNGPLPPGGRPRDNGARLEFVIRGTNVKPGTSTKHASKITFYLVVDKNRDNVKQYPGEGVEYKTSETWNWMLRHHVRLTVETINGVCWVKCWVDGEFVFDLDKSAPYYNPNPVIYFGGSEFNVDYHAPKGARLSNFRIYNLQ